jgi:hypothetical protein
MRLECAEKGQKVTVKKLPILGNFYGGQKLPKPALCRVLNLADFSLAEGGWGAIY